MSKTPETSDAAKKFLCVWGEGYGTDENPSITETHYQNWFTSDIGYTSEMVDAIGKLFIGESYNVPDLCSCHSIIRIQ
jgi:hypothetical protein